MATSDHSSLIDAIAGELIAGDPSDVDSLQTIVSLCGQLAQALAEAGDDEHVPAVCAARDLLTAAIEEPEAREKATFDELEALIEALQQSSASTSASAGTKAGGEPLVLSEWVEPATLADFVSSQLDLPDDLEGIILNKVEMPKGWRRTLIGRIHGLKGDSGVLGLYGLQQVCHVLEELIDLAPEGDDTLDQLLAVRDWIATALAAYGAMRHPVPSAESMTETLRVWVAACKAAGPPPTITAPAPSAPEAVPSAPEAAPSAPEAAPSAQAPRAVTRTKVARDEDTVTLIGDFIQEAEDGLGAADGILLRLNGASASADDVNTLFRIFHTIKGIAGFLDMDAIARLSHKTETLLNLCRESVIALDGGVLDLVFDATSGLRAIVDETRHAVETGTEAVIPPSVEPLIARLEARAALGASPATGAAPPVPAAVSAPRPSPPPPAPKAAPSSSPVQAAPPPRPAPAAPPPAPPAAPVAPPPPPESAVPHAPPPTEATSRNSGAPQGGQKIRETLKVDLERVDSLVEMIGELVVVEAMVANAPEISSIVSQQVQRYLGQFTKITRDLQTVGMSMRMIPVRGVFQKMARMVRDLAHKSGKEIQLETSGDGTEMDRRMVEQLADPLVHMIRNAADHGIEPPAERVAAGKAPTGTIHLSAQHEGGSIVIEISDDGHGLSRERILDKARSRGLVSDGESLSDSDVFSLIFAPGFSTAEVVTEISGRGVGMDVVRRNIEGMRGRVSIESVLGQGTKFRIILPLTLAIIDGMLVACGSERYILPTLSIVESIRPTKDMLLTIGENVELLLFRGTTLPMVRLSSLFRVDDAEADPVRGLIVIVEAMGRRLGLMVDDVVRQQQVVIKSIESTLADSKYLSGAAILSDGHVGLILDVDALGSLSDAARFRARGGRSASSPARRPGSPTPSA